jgi:hypothetical protein
VCVVCVWSVRLLSAVALTSHRDLNSAQFSAPHRRNRMNGVESWG